MTCRAAIVICLVMGVSRHATAYNVFPFPLGLETGYSKWNGPLAGVAGGTVTWSLMPTGTGRDASAPDYISGVSDLSGVFAPVGGEAAAIALIEQAFDSWEQAANIDFHFVGVDSGLAFSAPYAEGQQVGDIRIGGYAIDGFSAAVGFAPPPNGGTTLEGDIIFNSRPDIAFYHAPESEGELYDLYPPGGGLYRNDFVGLVAHEIGHALGLAHSDVPDGLMCGYVSPEFDGTQCAYFDADGDGRAPINRAPDADDIAGIQFLYGPRTSGPQSADFDGSGVVDGSDFLIWQRGLRATASLPIHGDANGDGATDGLDLEVWRLQFAAGGATRVPEPSGIMAALTATLVALVLRRAGVIARVGRLRADCRW